MDFIWVFFLISGFLFSFINGNFDYVSATIINSTSEAVNLCFSLLGIICFWNGIMKIALESGVIDKFSGIFKPFLCLLFPNIPSNHPAMNSIVMNLSANLLGLGNAATPFGMKAMEEMQKINLVKDEPSDDMCMFLIINNCLIQILPTTLLSLRSSLGSLDPSYPLPFIWIVTSITFVLSIVLTFVFRKIWERFDKI